MKFLLFFFFGVNILAQSDKCVLEYSQGISQFSVDKKDILCLAKNSTTEHTIFLTFASWCKPCRLHLPDAIYLEKNHNVKLYLVLPDSEGGKRLASTISYLKQNYPKVEMLVLKSATYGESLKDRNRKFVEDITPSNLEMIDDFSKFILVSKNGDIKYVTNWKDYNDDWKDGKAMLERSIIPLLQ